MLNIIFGAVIGAAMLPAGAGPGPDCCLRPQSIIADTPPPETAHRIGHVVTPAVVTTTFYGTALYFGASRNQARIVAIAASLVAIVGKELYDHSTEARAFSKLDIALGLAGTAAGLAAAEAIEWPEEMTERSRE